MYHLSTLKLQLHDAIYRLRLYSNSLIHILSLSNSHNNVASIQKNRGDKSHRVIAALLYKSGYIRLKQTVATHLKPITAGISSVGGIDQFAV